MKLSEMLKNTAYAIMFGFFGLIIGIWIADLLSNLIFKNLERVTTIYISVVIVVLVIVSASILGFTKGKKLLIIKPEKSGNSCHTFDEKPSKILNKL